MLIPSTTLAGGGRPLDDTIIGSIKIEEDHEKVYRDQLDIMLEFDGIQQPFDPEYLEILADFDRRHDAFKASHRDLQWQIVASTMIDLPPQDRLALMRNVRTYPLWRQLPPTVAITPEELRHWNCCRQSFLKRVKKNISSYSRIVLRR